MSQESRLVDFVALVGADIRTLTTEVRSIVKTSTVNTIDGGASPSEVYNGEAVDGGATPDAPYDGVNGGFGDYLHIGPTNEIPADRTGLWVDTSVPGKMTMWVKESTG